MHRNCVRECNRAGDESWPVYRSIRSVCPIGVNKPPGWLRIQEVVLRPALPAYRPPPEPMTLEPLPVPRLRRPAPLLRRGFLQASHTKPASAPKAVPVTAREKFVRGERHRRYRPRRNACRNHSPAREVALREQDRVALWLGRIPPLLFPHIQRIPTMLRPISNARFCGLITPKFAAIEAIDKSRKLGSGARLPTGAVGSPPQPPMQAMAVFIKESRSMSPI